MYATEKFSSDYTYTLKDSQRLHSYTHLPTRFEYAIHLLILSEPTASLLCKSKACRRENTGTHRARRQKILRHFFQKPCFKKVIYGLSHLGKKSFSRDMKSSSFIVPISGLLDSALRKIYFFLC